MVYLQNQPIGVVVAETFETAAYAASLVRYQYETQTPRTEMEREKKHAYRPGTANQDPTDIEARRPGAGHGGRRRRA